MPKWDHFCSFVSGDQDEAARYLNEASENGWELVSWSISRLNNLACFKRPRVTAPAPGDVPLVPPAATPAGH